MIAYIKALRPKQWVKSAFVLAPLIFSLQFDDKNKIIQALIATLCFIFISSIIYVFNDLVDAKDDRKHPIKKFRPIASGKISSRNAQILILILIAISYIFISMLPKPCYFIMLGYIIMNIGYTTFLKKFAIVDVIIIASGFVLRILMGGFAIDTKVSPWIILTTFLLALFLGFGKRRYELRLGTGNKTRESLSGYNAEFLDKLINVTCATTLVCYVIYIAQTAEKTGKAGLVYTIAFVVFGLFRYLKHLYFHKEGGEPETTLYKDKLFLANLVLWLISTILILSF